MEKLKTAYQRVAWLLEKVPATQANYKLLMLLYWQVFNGIDIPKHTIQEIIEKGTEPETINRAKRKVLETNNIIEDIEKIFKEVFEDGKGDNQSED